MSTLTFIAMIAIALITGASLAILLHNFGWLPVVTGTLGIIVICTHTICTAIRKGKE